MDILQTLSLARTALDDPAGIPPGAILAAAGRRETRRITSSGQTQYAIDRIDRAMHALDVELHPALALTTMGKLIEEIGNQLEAEEDGGTGVNVVLADALYTALDSIDRVIEALDARGGERHP